MCVYTYIYIFLKEFLDFLCTRSYDLQLEIVLLLPSLVPLFFLTSCLLIALTKTYSIMLKDMVKVGILNVEWKI